MKFLLVHSPVVGPATWRWAGDAVRARGHESIIPNLVDAATKGDPREFARSAAAAAGKDEVVVVGHSGAGGVLPLIIELVAAHRVIFVDATVPPCDGSFTLGAAFTETLRGLAIDGVLPPWSQWWGDGAMQALVPDDDRRRDIELQFPSVPLAWFESEIAAPTSWCDADGSFLLLSEPYRPDADRAGSLGWPVIERLGMHLDIANSEEVVADVLVDLASR
jgi:hypothetical protein